MNKTAKILLISIAVVLVVVLIWIAKKNSKPPVEYTTETAYTTTIVKKAVATGNVIPLEEIAVKPQVSGIISKIYVEEGAEVKTGDLIATIRVVPDVAQLNSSKGRVNNAELEYKNSKIMFERNEKLFNKGVISEQEFQDTELRYNNAMTNLENAKIDLEIIEKGYSSGMGEAANTNIRAEIAGTILEIPVKKGNQVIESNTFNDGTTIATIADMSQMIFEGQVDEAEVGKLLKGTVLEVSLGAIDEKKFPAKLNFIAPKGTEEGGAVQFKIKADVQLDQDFFVRAGYSANADIVLEEKMDVMAIKEALLRFEKDSEEPYVEVKKEDGTYERRTLKLGLSDGVNVEILEGLSMEDEIKVWNKAKKSDEEKEEEK
ncbi:MAG: efflux RND transporter periplasmic adaptor subunit [Flavobacteriaceae bacterium]